MNKPFCDMCGVEVGFNGRFGYHYVHGNGTTHVVVKVGVFNRGDHTDICLACGQSVLEELLTTLKKAKP